MLELFRRNQIVFYSFVFLYSIAICVPNFLSPDFVHISDGGPLYGYIRPSIEQMPVISKIICFFLLFVKAYILNNVVNTNRMSPSSSLIPGVLYILLVQLYPDFLFVSSIFIGNFFLILGLKSFFDTDQRNRRLHRLFNTYFWCAVASLFSPMFVMYFVAFLLASRFFTNVKWKDVLVMIMGGITPFYLFLGMCYLFDDLTEVWHAMTYGELLGWDFSQVSTMSAYVKVGIFVALGLILVASRGDMMRSINVVARRKLNVIYVLLFFVVLGILIYVPFALEHLLFVVPLFAVLFASVLLVLRNKQLAEIIHLLFLAVMVIFQYFIS